MFISSDKFRILFRERRAIFQEKPSGASGSSPHTSAFIEKFPNLLKPEDFWDVLILSGAQILDSLTGVVYSGTRLLNMATNGVENTINLVGKGLIQLEGGIYKLIDFIEDPGKPNKDMPEFDEMPIKMFAHADEYEYIDTKFPILNNIRELHVNAIFLDYKIKEHVKFHKDFIEKFNWVEQEIEKRKKHNPRKDLVEEKIKDIKAALDANDADYESPSPGEDAKAPGLRKNLKDSRNVLKGYEDDSSMIVEMDRPVFQSVEFPPPPHPTKDKGNPALVKRFKIVKGDLVNVDLEALKGKMDDYNHSYNVETKLEEYIKEMTRCVYHRDHKVELLVQNNGGNMNATNFKEMQSLWFTNTTPGFQASDLAAGKKVKKWLKTYEFKPSDGLSHNIAGVISNDFDAPLEAVPDPSDPSRPVTDDPMSGDEFYNNW